MVVLPAVHEMPPSCTEPIPLAVTTPPPLEEVKLTVSPETGALAPEAPPFVADQLAVLVVSHMPVPPTQNLDAIYTAPTLDID